MKNNSTVLFITHDISEAVLVADKVFVLPYPPISKLTEIEIFLERPRSLYTTEKDGFHKLISEVRKNLILNKK